MPGTSQFAQLFVNCLAVLGGFLAGYLLTALFANAIDRMAFRRKSPQFLHRSLRLLGGIALAALVAFIVFGHGRGWNLLGGGQDGTGESEKTGSPSFINVTPEKPAPPSPPPTPVETSGKRIAVTILGGTDVKAQRFYLIDADATPKSLAEAKEIIRRAAEGAEMAPNVEIRFAASNRLAFDHPAVTLLQQWLRKDLKLNVIFPPDGQ